MSKFELRYTIISGTIFCIVYAFLIHQVAKDKNQIKSNQDYTTGIVTETYKGVKSTIPSVKFDYSINGVKYKGGQGYDPKIYDAKVGKNYLIIYSPDNPTNSRILLKVMLPDSAVAPDDGWRNAPFGVIDSIDISW